MITRVDTTPQSRVILQPTLIIPDGCRGFATRTFRLLIIFPLSLHLELYQLQSTADISGQNQTFNLSIVSPLPVHMLRSNQLQRLGAYAEHGRRGRPGELLRPRLRNHPHVHLQHYHGLHHWVRSCVWQLGPVSRGCHWDCWHFSGHFTGWFLTLSNYY